MYNLLTAVRRQIFFLPPRQFDIVVLLFLALVRRHDILRSRLWIHCLQLPLTNRRIMDGLWMTLKIETPVTFLNQFGE